MLHGEGEPMVESGLYKKMTGILEMRAFDRSM